MHNVQCEKSKKENLKSPRHQQQQQPTENAFESGSKTQWNKLYALHLYEDYQKLLEKSKSLWV